MKVCGSILLLVSAIFASGSQNVYAGAQCPGFLTALTDENGSGNMTRIGYPFKGSLDSFDPQVVNTTTDANLSRNLYSRLVNLDNDGQLTAGLAMGIEWKDGKYALEIRNDTQTADGHTISTYDVYISLLRILIRNSNTHGSLRPFLCEPGISPSLVAGCAGLSYDSTAVYLKPIDKKKRFFLIPLLASTDFSIIPAIALDLTKKEMPIVEHRNTSGPYHLAASETSSAIRLVPNKSNYLYAPNLMPEIELVPTSGKSSFDLFRTGKLDVITTINGGEKADFLNAAGVEGTIHQTQPIKLNLLTMTLPGRKRHSLEIRLAVGFKIADALWADYHDSDRNRTDQFFPPTSEGRLMPEQIKEIERLKKQPRNIPDSVKFVFGAHPSQVEHFRALFQHIPSVEVRGYNLPPWTLAEAEQPDMYFADTDTSFYEDISLLHYNFSSGRFGTAQEGDRWLDDYMSTENKAERIEKLNRLHFSILQNGFVFPVAIGSYFALARKPLEISMSKLFAGTPFWKITIPSSSGQ